jgi:hypothetical protein
MDEYEKEQRQCFLNLVQKPLTRRSIDVQMKFFLSTLPSTNDISALKFL